MEGAEFPFVSVVVPVRNEARTIDACLDAVAAQDVPAGRLEILVVDDGSTDGTPGLVERAAERHDVPIRLLRSPGRYVPAALNAALAVARGEYFVRVDGHSAPTPDYVRRSVEGNREHGAALAGGWVRAVGSNGFGRAVAAALASPLGMGNAASWRAPEAPRDVASVPCGSYRTETLRSIGGFDEGQLANQDYEANYRLRLAGHRVVLLPDIWFDYVPRSTLRALLRQMRRYGFYKARTMAKHPASIRPRHLVPAAALVGAAALAITGFAVHAAWLVLAFAAALYLVGVAGAAVAAVRSIGRDAAWLLAVLPAIHLAWGAGNLAGLVRYVPARRSLAGSTGP